MSATTTTADEAFDSLNGFDEIAIAKQFGNQIHQLHPDNPGGSPFGFLRALVFVDLRRNGEKDAEAFTKAMTLSVRDLNTYFAEAEPEIDPDDPDTDLGKDSTPSD